MATMKAALVPRAGADFEIVEREIPVPGPGHVRIRVQACGVCHSDVLTKEGGWPGLVYPRVPGHEVAGVIDKTGPGVTQWTNGQRVGVGWHGGQDGTCLACRRGDFVNCAHLKVTGLSYDGGYQEYMIAPVDAVARMPESLNPAEAAPLLCAGITTFNALRHSGARPSDLVAVQGIGGLGHLGIQFAQKFGYQVAAIGRGPENAALAKQLGASVYIDSVATNAAAELQKLGGARVILATAPSSKAMSSLVDGLGVNGRMMVVGGDDGSDRSDAGSVDLRQPERSGLGVGNPDRLGGYAAVCRANGRAADDRAVSAGEGGRRVRADDEREGGVSRRPDDVGVRWVERAAAVSAR
jgi:D-arabinose 1-dehydrogenase-like Zn-dependent alcohol dehydrogenase